MQRNISITEFINSLGEVKDSLFQNTLKHLYNADSQNGLYIFKAPLGAGKSVLRNLLLLYRISKLATIPSSEYYAIDFFDENIDLSQKGILELLDYSNLFAKCDNENIVLENSEMDKIHIYYSFLNPGLIQFGKNVFLRFRKIENVVQNTNGIYSLDEDRHLVCTNLPFDGKNFIKLKGVVVNVHSPEFSSTVDFIFKKIVEEKKYKHEKGMSIDPLQISLNPFAMFDINSEILKELDSSLIEFNGWDTILVESPQTVFNEKKVLNVENANVSQILSHFGYDLKISIPRIISTNSSEIKVLEKEPVSEENEKVMKEKLADIFGLTENWDYVKKGQEKLSKDDEFEISIKQIIEMRKQKNYSILDNWDKKPKQLRVLLANQAKYMEVLPEPMMNALGKLVALNYDKEATCCSPEDVLNIIEDRYCKFIKQSKDFKNSFFDERTGLRLKVAETSTSFGKKEATFQDVQFLNVQTPVKDFDTIGVLVPIIARGEKVGIFGVTFNGNDLI